MNSIDRDIEALKGELIELRRDFHRHPELGFREVRTAGIVAAHLAASGLAVRTGVAVTGVVGLLEGRRPGPTLMLRADMDALPVQEENEVPYRSLHDGRMHACGHDGHTAMLLVAARILAGRRDRLRGNVKFVFQPNEEEAGAQRMVDEGVLDGPRVDAAVGLHLWSQIATGRLAVAPGPIMASADYFKLTIHGRGGHGGAPHGAVDPVLCASAVIQAVQAIQTREIDAFRPTVITFCRIQGGASPIVIPDRIVLEGSIRCLYEGAEEVQERFRRIAGGICAAHRTTCELDVVRGNSLLANDPRLARWLGDLAERVLGPDRVERSIRMMIGEDFAEFSRVVPGVFCFLGAGSEAKGTCQPHHHPRFDLDEDALPLGVAMHVRTALDYLGA
jgi:amidohydrolase